MNAKTRTDLSAISVKPLVGDEPFRHHGLPLSTDALSFWRWAYSNLAANNLRGHLAEFFVASALNTTNQTRIEWDGCDVRTSTGIRVEVKSAAYLQTWEQKKHSTITFNIAPTRAYDTKLKRRSGQPSRNSDVFVFCLLSEKDKKNLDPMNLDMWQFLVLPTAVLNKTLREQKTLSLNRLIGLKPVQCAFDQIADAVKLVTTQQASDDRAIPQRS